MSRWKRGRGYIDLPDEVQATVRRSHQHFVRGTRVAVSGALRSLGTAFGGAAAAGDALAGFVEAVRPYKRVRTEVFNMDYEPGQILPRSSGMTTKRVQVTLGQDNPKKRKQIATMTQTWQFRGFGTGPMRGYESKIYRVYGGGECHISTVGSYPMINMVNVGINQVGDRIRQLFPAFGWSLTCTPNAKDVGGTTSVYSMMDAHQYRRDTNGAGTINSLGYYPLYLYGAVANGASVVNDAYRGCTEQGIKTSGNSENWNAMYNIPNNTVPHSICLLKRVRVSLDLWGAKKAPTNWKFQIVQYKANTGPAYTTVGFPPNVLGTNVTSQYVEYDGAAPGGFGNAVSQHANVWTGLTNHPWVHNLLTRHATHKVLYERKIFQPANNNDDDDVLPNHQMIDFNVELNRICNYAWHQAATITNLESTANSAEIMNNEDISVDVHPQARLYFLVTCDNYTRVSAVSTETTPGVHTPITDDFIPSFNIKLTKTNELVRR